MRPTYETSACQLRGTDRKRLRKKHICNISVCVRSTHIHKRAKSPSCNNSATLQLINSSFSGFPSVNNAAPAGRFHTSICNVPSSHNCVPKGILPTPSLHHLHRSQRPRHILHGFLPKSEVPHTRGHFLEETSSTVGVMDPKTNACRRPIFGRILTHVCFRQMWMVQKNPALPTIVSPSHGSTIQTLGTKDVYHEHFLGTLYFEPFWTNLVSSRL